MNLEKQEIVNNAIKQFNEGGINYWLVYDIENVNWGHSYAYGEGIGGVKPENEQLMAKYFDQFNQQICFALFGHLLTQLENYGKYKGLPDPTTDDVLKWFLRDFARVNEYNKQLKV